MYSNDTLWAVYNVLISMNTAVGQRNLAHQKITTELFMRSYYIIFIPRDGSGTLLPTSKANSFDVVKVAQQRTNN